MDSISNPDMSIIDGLSTRRSVYDYTDDCPEFAAVKASLDAAVLAPNHRKTKPWRFVVTGGASATSSPRGG